MADEEIVKLKHQVSLIRSEIDELGKEKPWYQNISIIIAMSALLLSIVTTSVSYIRSAHEDYLSSRVELRELVSQLTMIPIEHANVAETYAGKPQVLSQLSAQLNTKNLMLGRQAVSVVERLESSLFGRDSVLDVEFVAIGTALGNSYIYDIAEEYFDKGVSRTSDPATAAGALRARASMSLVKRDTDELRALMSEASVIFKKVEFESAPQIYKDVTNATTYIQWAIAESILGNCAESESHIQAATPLMYRIPESALKQQIAAQIQYISNQVNICNNHSKSNQTTSYMSAD